ncbi:MAG: putative YigZ family protein [Bacteroidia bacterium]|jgi:uncharacterized YigZ family protein
MRTISKSTEGLFKDRGSKFVSYAFPIHDVADVKPLLDVLRTEHPSSRHVCYAYQLGADGADYRANDDGEPGGSAGLPILNQIKSKDVSNVLVAVVRYFGGTKLGVSGLVNAYKEAAKEALENVKVVIRIPKSVVRIQFPHSSTGDVERLIRQNNWVIKNQEFGMDCIWDIETPLNEEVKHHFLKPIVFIRVKD